VYIENNPIIVGIVLVVLGLLVGFKGRKFIPWVIGSLSCVATCILLMMLFQWLGFLDFFLVDEEGELTTAIFSILIAAFIGLLVGYFFMTRLLYYGFAIVGAVGGFFVGSIFYNLVMIEWADTVLAFWFTLIGFAILGAILAMLLTNSIVIISTSLLGSYLFFRGLSMFFGGFPTEVEVYNQIKTDTADFTTTFLIYLVGIIVLGFVCIIFQYKEKKAESGDDQYKIHR